MKVCLVAFGNFMVVPYMRTYVNILEKNGIKYDIIYWNRNGLKEKGYSCANLYEYDLHVDETRNLFKKVVPMIGYARFVKRILKENKYDRIVILSSLPGVLLERFLVANYKGRYIFDIRDYSYEHIRWYYKKMESVMDNSALNVISSPGFKNFLPPKECYVDHNSAYSQIGHERFLKKEGIISIGFIGVIRFTDDCKLFLERIKNDSRFVFNFYGEGVSEKPLKEYCEQEKIRNVNFHGRYMPEEKSDITRKTDLIFNVYEKKSMKYAMTNRYYDALYFKKPLLVSKDTTMEEYSRGLALSIDYGSECVADNIIQWYSSLDEDYINRTSEAYLNNALQENEVTHERIRKILVEE